MSYLVIERMPFPAFIQNEDGIPREFESMLAATTEAANLQDPIIIDSYLDIRDIITILTESKFLIETGTMKGISDKNNILPAIEEVLKRFATEGTGGAKLPKPEIID